MLFTRQFNSSYASIPDPSPFTAGCLGRLTTKIRGNLEALYCCRIKLVVISSLQPGSFRNINEWKNYNAIGRTRDMLISPSYEISNSSRSVLNWLLWGFNVASGRSTETPRNFMVSRPCHPTRKCPDFFLKMVNLCETRTTKVTTSCMALYRYTKLTWSYGGVHIRVRATNVDTYTKVDSTKV